MHLDRSPKMALRKSPPEVLDVEEWAPEAMPEMRPYWDFKPEKDKKFWVSALMPFSMDFEWEPKSPTNMSKITIIIIIKPDETPTNFYERLCETFWIYILFDPETAENQQMINAAFVAQSCADIQ